MGMDAASTNSMLPFWKIRGCLGRLTELVVLQRGCENAELSGQLLRLGASHNPPAFATRSLTGFASPEFRGKRFLLLGCRRDVFDAGHFHRRYDGDANTLARVQDM
jgi:hypothetical protein